MLVTCRRCKSEVDVPIKPEDYRLWKTDRSTYIQDVAPYLDAGQREILLSGICGKCFDELFPEDDR